MKLDKICTCCKKQLTTKNTTMRGKHTYGKKYRDFKTLFLDCKGCDSTVVLISKIEAARINLNEAMKLNKKCSCCKTLLTTKNLLGTCKKCDLRLRLMNEYKGEFGSEIK